MHQLSFGFNHKAIIATWLLLTTFVLHIGASTNSSSLIHPYEELDDNNRTSFINQCTTAEQAFDLIVDVQIVAPTTVSYQAQTNVAATFAFSAADEDWININEIRDELVANNRSFFAWVKAPAALGGSQTLFGVNQADGRDQAFFGITSNKNLRLNNGASFNAGRITSTAALGDGWHFVGYTYNHATNQSRIYLDGIEVASATNNYDSESGDLYSIGQYYDRSNTTLHFDGEMTEVSIWNEELTAAEVRAAMGQQLSAAHPKYANLIAYYAPYGNCDDHHFSGRSYCK